MNTTQLFGGALLAVGLAAGGLYLGLDGGEAGASDGGVTPSLATAAPVRMARLPTGKCDETKCPQGIIQGDGWCACLTTAAKAEPVAEEVSSKDDLAAKDTRSMVLCPQTDGGAGGVSYPLASAELPKDCIRVLPKVLLPGITTNSVITGIEADLEVACSPCKVAPGAWGPCPHCLAWPGGCAKACPVADGGVP